MNGKKLDWTKHNAAASIALFVVHFIVLVLVSFVFATPSIFLS